MKILPFLLLISIPWTLAADDSTTAVVSSTDAPSTSSSATEPTTAAVETTKEPVLEEIAAKRYMAGGKFSEPVRDVYGSFPVKGETHDTGRPGWMSIWKIQLGETQFGIYFWPPKYCHAVYICPVKEKKYDGINIHFDEFDCDSMYLKFYPHIRQVFFKPDEKAEESSAFYVEPALQFQKEGDEFMLKALKKEPADHKNWEEMMKNGTYFVELKWNLKDKDLLILTNSRMCEVNKPNSETFFPIMDSQQETDVSKRPDWPKWLMETDPAKAATEQYIPTVNMASTGGSEKTVDLLEYLKRMKPAADNKLGKIPQRCSSYDKGGVAQQRRPVYEHSIYPSVASYSTFVPSISTVGLHYILRLSFTLSNCNWVRFWATNEPDLKNYVDKMELKDTLDLFLQEGFYLPPDSDIPVELPDVQLMDRIQLTIMRKKEEKSQAPDPKADDHELIEFAFGTADENLLFRQFFKGPSFGRKSTNIHVIRSPECQANLQVKTGYFDGNAAEPYNLKDVTSCQYSYLIPK